jgi:hypothetical protein
LVLVAGWADAAAAAAWAPRDAPRCDPRHRTVRIIRDYGMADRREAPQYFPDVTR